ncbi:MAG: LPS export ABC transporter periplasmic protein LptC, partial [Pseudomonadota bacterium]
RLDNPRFQGATDGGEPFTLSAITATPDGPLAAEIALDAPEGTLTMGDGRLVEGRADEGMMLRDENELTLTGAVTITTSDGYRFETQTLTLDIADGGATAPSAIEGTGPQGSIVADRMTIETVPEGGEETEFRRQGLSGARFRFEGSVRVLFTPEVKD